MVADVIGVVSFLIAVISFVSGDDIARTLLAGYLCALVTALLVWTGRTEARNARLTRRASQADALPRLVDTVDQISHATLGLLAGGADDAFVARVTIALGHLAEMYGIATGVPCRVTLKATYKPPRHPGRDLAVETVCRSSGHAGGQSVTGIDWINDNTDFRKIFNEGAEIFFCNDLPAEIPKGYRNSHFTDDVIASGSFPYRATIVWPVRGRLGDPTRDVDRWEVIGFLCVDTLRTYTFDRELDVAPGEVCAHALYSGLRRFRENQSSPRAGNAGKGRDRRSR